MGEFGRFESGAQFGDGVNWAGVSHQQLWEWFGDGRTGVMTDLMQEWRDKIAANFQAAADKVGEALRNANVAWEGPAADAMQAGTAPLADHARITGDDAGMASTMTGRQSMEARSVGFAMPEPKPVPSQRELLDASGGNLFQSLNDASALEAAAREDEERARDLARAYDSGTDSAIADLPLFTVAPSFTTGVGDPEPSTGAVEYRQPKPDSGDWYGPGGTNGPGPAGPGPGGGPGPSGESGPEVGTEGAVRGSSTEGDRPGGTSGQGWTPTVSTSSQVVGAPVGPSPTSVRPGALPPSVVVGGGPTGGGPAGGRSEGGPGGRGRGGPGLGAGGRYALGGERETVLNTGPRNAAKATNGMAATPSRNRAKGDEDGEHETPSYLIQHHDDFWDDTPPTAPPVIGEDDD